MNNYLKLTIVTPTLNSQRTLEEYLQAIFMQDYPHKYIDIVIADAGSKDKTSDILKKYKNKKDIKINIIDNPLKTGEAGKAVGTKNSKGDIICFLDSDNIIPDANWISKMMSPFNNKNIIASEPIEYTYRKSDNIINRYAALLGMNDPLCLFTKNYDRYCAITNKWCEVKREEIDEGNYLSIRFLENTIPTIGANGFFIRKKQLLDNFVGDYLFDIDVIYKLLNKDNTLRIAKVKTGIVHLFCFDTKTFIRKQSRRINDYLYFSDSNQREYPWSKVSKIRIIIFVLCTITIIPLIIQALIGYSRKKDIAWIYHVPACIITLFVYGFAVIKSIFFIKPSDRKGWKQ